MGAPPLTWSEIVKQKSWLHSPTLNAWQKKVLANLKQRAPVAKDVLWLLSSGTQSVDEVKAIGLPKQAVLCSAEGVNKHLAVKASDRWLLTLPEYHIGGLSILARAHLSGSQVFVQRKWDAVGFVDLVRDHSITLCSLVPTQVFDLVSKELECPASLRAIVVGGGSLDPSLYMSARRFGWPLLPSYGLTECSSQVATAPLSSLASEDIPLLQVLPHVEVELRDQRVFLRSKALCRWIVRGNRHGQYTLEDPLREGWLPTEDLGELRETGLHILGRRDDVVKVLGVLVSVNQVEHQAREFFLQQKVPGDLTVLAVSGGREGHRLVLVTDSSYSLNEWQRQIEKFNQSVSGPFRLKQFCWVPAIPRSDLGKVKRAALLEGLRLC